MFSKFFVLVFGAFLVACGSTSTSVINQSFDLPLMVNQEVRGVSATIEYQPQDSFTTQNVMLATDAIPAITLPIEGDSVSVP